MLERIDNELTMLRKHWIKYCFICFVFFIWRAIVLENVLHIMEKYAFLSFSHIKKLDYIQEKIFVLEQQNQELKELLGLQQNSILKNVVYGNVVNNIYSSLGFWAYFKNSKEISINKPVFYKNRLIGFVVLQKGCLVQILPISHSSVKFSAKTQSGVGILLQGNGSGLNVILHNFQELQQGESVFFENNYEIGVIDGNCVKIKDFARIEYLCVDI